MNPLRDTEYAKKAKENRRRKMDPWWHKSSQSELSRKVLYNLEVLQRRVTSSICSTYFKRGGSSQADIMQLFTSGEEFIPAAGYSLASRLDQA